MVGPDKRISGVRRLSIEDKSRLADAVGSLDVMADARQRRILLDELHEQIGDDFDPAEFSESVGVWPIVSACIRLGGVRELLGVLRLLGGKTREWLSLSAVVDELFPVSPLAHDERRRLEALLEPVPRESLAEIFAGLELAPCAGFDGTDGAEVLPLFEAATAGRPDADELLLVFLEQVAHRSTGHTYLELHSLINSAAARLGRDEFVAKVCRATLEGAASNPPFWEDTTEQAEKESIVSEPALLTTGDDVRTNALPTVAADALPMVAVPAVWGGVPPRNRNFTGREDTLETLRSTLRHHVRATVLPQTLQGLGGVGKSQLAIEYAYRYQNDYDLIWWIPADDELSVRRSLTSLARRLGLPESQDVQFTIEAALDELRLGKLHPHWLVVYDNAGEPEEMRRYLPTGAGHVLVTSRSRSWVSQSNIVEVNVFSPNESVELLTQRWEELGRSDALTLAERLGHLPLALEQAVAVHQETGMPLEEYLRLLDASPVEMLDEGRSTEYPLSVAKTWRLAFEQLRERSPGAAQLLQLCAFLSSHPISVPMLTRGRGAELPTPLNETLRDEIKLRRAVRDIGRYALAQLDTGRDFIRIHMLVRAVLRDGLPEEEREATERRAHNVLALANPGAPDRDDTWYQHRQVAPHVVPSGVIFSGDPHVRRIVLDQIRYYYVIGDMQESRALAERAVDHWRGSLGPDDEMTLLAAFHLGNALRGSGEYQSARDLNQDTLRRMSQTLGHEHEHALRVANSVGADMRLLGEFTDACALDTDNLAHYRSGLGDDDPATLRAANNLAVDYRLLGEFQQAKDIDEENLRRRIDILGEDNAEVLSSINALVGDLYGLGDYADALKLQLEKLATYEQRLPINHSFLLTARRNVAVLLRKTGDYAKALRQAELNYEVTRGLFGPRRERVLAAMMTYFNSIRVQGDPVRARDLGDQALASYRGELGEEHPFTLACAVNLAIVYRALGHQPEAAELGEQAYHKLVRALGETHPYTLSCGANMTNDLAAVDRFEDAKALSEQILTHSRRVRPPDHPATLACAANLALDLDLVGEHAEATALRHDTRDRLRRRLGPEHPETINMERGRRAEVDIEIASP